MSCLAASWSLTFLQASELHKGMLYALDSAFAVAYADGKPDELQLRALKQIAKDTQLTDLDFREVKKKHERLGSRSSPHDDFGHEQRHGRSHSANGDSAGDNGSSSKDNSNDAKRYGRTLGLEGKVTKATIRQAYRDAVKQYHPDRVEQMGKEIREVAVRKTKEINEAYDYFKRRYDL